MKPAVLLEAFNRGDLFPGCCCNFSDAGTCCLAVDEHGACAALTFAAAVFAAGQVEIVTQDAQQASITVGVDPHPRSIDLKFSDSLHRTPSRRRSQVHSMTCN